MALEINNMYGVICLKGKVSNSHLQEIKRYFEVLLQKEDEVIINFCQVKKGARKLTRILDTLKRETPQDKTLNYYGFTEPKVRELYAQINDPANYYQAA